MKVEVKTYMRELSDLIIKRSMQKGMLSSLDQVKFEACLNAHVQFMGTVLAFELLSYATYIVNDFEGQHEVCARIDEFADSPHALKA